MTGGALGKKSLMKIEYASHIRDSSHIIATDARGDNRLNLFAR
jgi:hypothetical protein